MEVSPQSSEAIVLGTGSQTQFTFKDVRLWCEIQSNGHRDHEDGEEQQGLEGWNQGAFISAKEHKFMSQPGSNHTGGGSDTLTTDVDMYPGENYIYVPGLCHIKETSLWYTQAMNGTAELGFSGH